jgi:hypothetical protein
MISGNVQYPEEEKEQRGTARTYLVSGHSIADAFWRQAALNAVSPIVAALLGGLVVSVLVQQAQDRRNRQQLRSTLSFEMMRTAYGFYFPLMEAVRRQHYSVVQRRAGRRFQLLFHPARESGLVDADDLPQQYEEFRIAARVIEEQLRVNFPNAEVRWLWHGIIDMLSARYFRLVHIPRRFNDMIKTHSEHPTDPEIPLTVQQLFMGLADYQDENTVDADLLRRFEIMLNEAIRVVLALKIDPPSGAAILQPGRGSKLITRSGD